MVPGLRKAMRIRLFHGSEPVRNGKRKETFVQIDTKRLKDERIDLSCKGVRPLWMISTVHSRAFEVAVMNYPTCSATHRAVAVAVHGLDEQLALPRASQASCTQQHQLPALDTQEVKRLQMPLCSRKKQG